MATESGDPCDEALDAALQAFRRQGQVEPGLAVSESALVQLRKACRILDGVRALQSIDRHYTMIIEGSFAAIERTIQFYLLEVGAIESGAIHDHETVFERAVDAGLYTASMGADLVRLWQNNRSATYYRESPATEEQATAMLALAECLHEHAPQLAGRRHDCLC